MTSTKYIGMDVHTESISIAVRNSLGKVVMESVSVDVKNLARSSGYSGMSLPGMQRSLTLGATAVLSPFH